MKNIVWLASYPKSGNTWFRIILDNLLRQNGEFDLNNLETSTHGSSRQIFNTCCGFDTSLLSFAEIDKLRPVVNDWYAQKAKKIIFRKIHDAYSFLDDGRPLTGNPQYFKTIYIIRNPLAIVSSLAHQEVISITEAIELMDNTAYAFCAKTNKFSSYLRQKHNSWSNHVLSWTECQELDLFTVRYEDLHHKPLQILRDTFSFAGLNIADSEIIAAIEKSTFAKVAKKESESGFRERPGKIEKFFRKGASEGWKEELTAEQAALIIKKHWQVMKIFGYLTQDVLQFARLKENDLIT